MTKIRQNKGISGIAESRRQTRSIKAKKSGRKFYRGGKSHKNESLTRHHRKHGQHSRHRQGHHHEQHHGHNRRYHQGYHHKQHHGHRQGHSKSHQMLGENAVEDDSGYDDGNGQAIDERNNEGDLDGEDKDGGYSHDNRYADQYDELDNRDETHRDKQANKNKEYTDESDGYEDEDESTQSHQRRPSAGDRLTEELYGLDKESQSSIEENIDQHSSEMRKLHGSEGGAKHEYAEESDDSNSAGAKWNEYDSERQEELEDDDMENLRPKENDDESAVEERSIPYNSDLDYQNGFDKWVQNEKNKG